MLSTMDTNATAKHTREREKPVHKWTDEETERMLNYLIRVGNLEKPTAQIYYKKMIISTGLPITWDIAKSKMQYLKKKYSAASKFIKSIENEGLTESGTTTIRGKVKKLCPQYDQLVKILGENVQDVLCVKNDQISLFNSNGQGVLFGEIEHDDLIIKEERDDITVLSETFMSESSMQAAEFMDLRVDKLPASPIDKFVTNSPSPIDSDSTSSIEAPATISSKRKKCKRNNNTNSNSLSELCKIERKRNDFRVKQLQLETENHKRKFEQDDNKIRMKLNLDERKFNFKMEMETKRFQLKEEKMRKEFEIKQMLLEKAERIAKYELELKYKYAKQK